MPVDVHLASIWCHMHITCSLYCHAKPCRLFIHQRCASASSSHMQSRTVLLASLLVHIGSKPFFSTVTAPAAFLFRALMCDAEEGSAIAADLAEAATRPIRQSSAIHFNAALGGWGHTPAVPARPLSARHMPAAPAVPAAVKTVQSPVVQPLATASTTMTSQRVGQMGTVPVSSNQQESRPRSSDGILQRITVDRGPATGV